MDNIWRKDFPFLKDGNTIYLDTAATALKPESVILTLDHYYRELSANIHRGVYRQAYEATKLYEESRETVARFLHADSREIVFTRGATSAMNLSASSFGSRFLRPGDEIIVSELEHHSHLLPWQQIAIKTGAKLVYVPLSSEGRITVEAFRTVLTAKTKVVALTYVSNVMGYVTPIAEIIRLSHAVGAVVDVDAAQAVQHLEIDVVALDVDFLSFSGHKMLGPTGIGVLYGKAKWLEQMEPIEYGGDMNDNVEKLSAEWKDIPHKFEAGTMPIAEVLGLRAAIDYLMSVGITSIEDHTRRLRQYAYTQLKKIEGIEIYNPGADTGIIAFNLLGVHPHDAATFFAERSVCLRAGHHCAQLVVKWLGIEACLRATFYLYNTYSDCDKFISAAQASVKFFREVGF